MEKERPLPWLGMGMGMERSCAEGDWQKERGGSDLIRQDRQSELSDHQEHASLSTHLRETSLFPITKKSPQNVPKVKPQMRGNDSIDTEL